jgi:hypothetical protein
MPESRRAAGSVRDEDVDPSYLRGVLRRASPKI